MRLPLLPRRDVGQRLARSRKGGVGAVPGPQRDQAVAAAEMVALVLDKSSPLPEGAGDVKKLARRLRGHISQLGLAVPAGAPVLRNAQQLASEGVPVGYMPSRVHLVKLARATQALVATVRAIDDVSVKRLHRRRWWPPQINALRGAVLAVALACLIVAASVPRT
ncbi:DUF6415 family natural product biosynthesis protein [Streptomyces sp. SUK 48]|uniref:DUF6415 family natural product biosynthesis protein n=1 Tax=Streptomyces sp. SUK 48 TaxID=2582831 RepID=UPI001FB9FCDB|nr:DUF6415 family natural product biosynthesis protein [Streptomyces sp. SUK 48]